VLALEGSQVIGDFGVDPMVITPNGDGVNDEMSFGFSIARLNANRAVTLRIFDLTGALVKEIAERRTDPRGRYGMRWSGVDDKGNVVPPGIYLARLQADVDSGSATGTSAERLIYVAY
jgi:flagellar hook assembly protein FlgD